jgi:acyl-CoA thioesterase
MADLAKDTAVEPTGEGRYRARLSEDWNLWGPVGGYLASVALRAAGAHTSMHRPASLSCHYLAPPRFDAVDLEVVRLRGTRRAESLRVAMSQDGEPVLDALVWGVAEGMAGPARNWVEPRPAPPPEALPRWDSAAEIGQDPVGATAFWRNIEIRKIPGDDGGPGEPRLRAWERYVPTSVFDDPWIDACRAAVSVDVAFFPAIAKGLPDVAFMAPNLDLYVAYHTTPPAEEFHLIESTGTVAGDGLVSGHVRVWSPSGALTASGSSQLLCRLL